MSPSTKHLHISLFTRIPAWNEDGVGHLDTVVKERVGMLDEPLLLVMGPDGGDAIQRLTEVSIDGWSLNGVDTFYLTSSLHINPLVVRIKTKVYHNNPRPFWSTLLIGSLLLFGLKLDIDNHDKARHQLNNVCIVLKFEHLKKEVKLGPTPPSRMCLTEMAIIN